MHDAPLPPRSLRSATPEWTTRGLLLCAAVAVSACGAKGSRAAAGPPASCAPATEIVPFARVMAHASAHTECPLTTEAALMTPNACVAIRAEAGEECFMFVPPNAVFDGGRPSAAPWTVIVSTKAADALYEAVQGTRYRLVGITRLFEQTPAAEVFAATTVERSNRVQEPAEVPNFGGEPASNANARSETSVSESPETAAAHDDVGSNQEADTRHEAVVP